MSKVLVQFGIPKRSARKCSEAKWLVNRVWNSKQSVAHTATDGCQQPCGWSTEFVLADSRSTSTMRERVNFRHSTS